MGSHILQLNIVNYYTSFRWTEDGRGFQIRYLTLDTWPGNWAVLIEIIKLVIRSKIHRGFEESGMQSCCASQLL